MDLIQLRRALAGVVAIPVTPFTPSGEIDELAYTKVLNHMIDGGIEVVTPNGNTGEFYALAHAEARRIVDLTMDVAGARAVIVVGVGGSVAQAIEAAQYARDAGAQAIMVHQPVHPYVSRAGWVDYHEQIAASVPSLGVITYLRNPVIAGSDIHELSRRSSNFIAVKYAVPDPVRFATVMQDSKPAELVWIAGLAELAAPGYFAYGATGFTSGLANIAPRLSVELLNALRAGDQNAVLRIWQQIRPFEELRARGNSENNVTVVKEALAQMDLCRRDVRPPISTLTDEDRLRVAESMLSWEAELEPSSDLTAAP